MSAAAVSTAAGAASTARNELAAMDIRSSSAPTKTAGVNLSLSSAAADNHSMSPRTSDQMNVISLVSLPRRSFQPQITLENSHVAAEDCPSIVYTRSAAPPGGDLPTLLIETELNEWQRCHERAGQSLEAGHYEETVHLCTTRIDDSLQNLISVANLNHQSAEELATRISIPSLGVYALRACAKMHLGDYHGAIRDLTYVIRESQVVANAPDLVALNLRVYAYLELEYFESAYQDLHVALRLSTSSHDTLALQAMLLCSAAPNEFIIMPAEESGAPSNERERKAKGKVDVSQTERLQAALRIAEQVLRSVPDHWLAKTVVEYVQALENSPKGFPTPTTDAPRLAISKPLSTDSSVAERSDLNACVTTTSLEEPIPALATDNQSANTARSASNSPGALYALLFHAKQFKPAEELSVTSVVLSSAADAVSETAETVNVSIAQSTSELNDMTFAEMLQKYRRPISRLKSSFADEMVVYQDLALRSATPSSQQSHVSVMGAPLLQAQRQTHPLSTSANGTGISDRFQTGSREQLTLSMLESTAPTVESVKTFRNLVHEKLVASTEGRIGKHSPNKPSHPPHQGTRQMPQIEGLQVVALGAQPCKESSAPQSVISPLDDMRSHSAISPRTLAASSTSTPRARPQPERLSPPRHLQLTTQRTSGGAISGTLMKDPKLRSLVAASIINKVGANKENKPTTYEALSIESEKCGAKPVVGENGHASSNVAERTPDPIDRQRTEDDEETRLGTILSVRSSNPIPLYLSSALGMNVSPDQQLAQCIRLQTQPGRARTLLADSDLDSDKSRAKAVKQVHTSAALTTTTPHVPQSVVCVIDDQIASSLREAQDQIQSSATHPAPKAVNISFPSARPQRVVTRGFKEHLQHTNKDLDSHLAPQTAGSSDSKRPVSAASIEVAPSSANVSQDSQVVPSLTVSEAPRCVYSAHSTLYSHRLASPAPETGDSQVVSSGYHTISTTLSAPLEPSRLRSTSASSVPRDESGSCARLSDAVGQVWQSHPVQINDVPARPPTSSSSSSQHSVTMAPQVGIARNTKRPQPHRGVTASRRLYLSSIQASTQALQRSNKVGVSSQAFEMQGVKLRTSNGTLQAPAQPTLPSSHENPKMSFVGHLNGRSGSVFGLTASRRCSENTLHTAHGHGLSRSRLLAPEGQLPSLHLPFSMTGRIRRPATDHSCNMQQFDDLLILTPITTVASTNGVTPSRDLNHQDLAARSAHAIDDLFPRQQGSLPTTTTTGSVLSMESATNSATTANGSVTSPILETQAECAGGGGGDSDLE